MFLYIFFNVMDQMHGFIYIYIYKVEIILEDYNGFLQELCFMLSGQLHHSDVFCSPKTIFILKYLNILILYILC